jgi:hypothetical protein
MNQYCVQKLGVRFSFREVYRILCILNRQFELEQLVQWAERKHLSRPLRLYRNRLADEESCVLRYRVDSPRLFAYAHLLFQLNNLISSPPRYPAKGSAKMYRYGRH